MKSLKKPFFDHLFVWTDNKWLMDWFLWHLPPSTGPLLLSIPAIPASAFSPCHYTQPSIMPPKSLSLKSYVDYMLLHEKNYRATKGSKCAEVIGTIIGEITSCEDYNYNISEEELKKVCVKLTNGSNGLICLDLENHQLVCKSQECTSWWATYWSG